MLLFRFDSNNNQMVWSTNDALCICTTSEGTRLHACESATLIYNHIYARTSCESTLTTTRMPSVTLSSTQNKWEKFPNENVIPFHKRRRSDPKKIKGFETYNNTDVAPDSKNIIIDFWLTSRWLRVVENQGQHVPLSLCFTMNNNYGVRMLVNQQYWWGWSRGANFWWLKQNN